MHVQIMADLSRAASAQRGRTSVEGATSMEGLNERWTSAYPSVEAETGRG